MSELREWYKAHGICVCCGQENVAVSGETLCLQCKFKYRESNRRYYANHKNELKHKVKDQKKQLYKERKEQGICVTCGKHEAQTGKVRCGKCLAKDRRMHIKKARAEGVLPHSMLGNGEYCYTCGKPANGAKLCPKCLETSRRTIAYARIFVKKGWQSSDFIFGKRDNNE